MQMSSGMAWISDSTGERIWFNESWLTFRGCSIDRERNSGWTLGVHVTFRDRLLEVITAAVATKSSYCVRYSVLQNDGTYKEISEQAVPLLTNSGDLVGHAGTCLVLSTEKASDPSSALFACEDSWREGIWCIDMNGNTTFVNSALARMLLCTREEMFGISFLAYMDEEQRPDAMKHLAARIAGSYVTHEFQFKKKNGETLWAVVTPIPLLNSESAVIGFKATVIDISDRVKTEERLREEDLRKNQFISMLAHELRNPLAPIRNAARIIRLQPGLSDDVIQAREIIERETHKMSRYLDDLLDIARISSGRMELKLELTDLTICIQRAIESVSNDLTAHSHILDVSGCEKPLYLRIDPIRIEQVLINLLSNSIKYSRFHGCIRIAMESDAEWVCVEVRDSGIGIAPDFMPHLFDMYARAQQPSSRDVAGSGVGLPLARKLIELHGGSIEARSAGLGHGSAFTFRLPIQLGEAG